VIILFAQLSDEIARERPGRVVMTGEPQVAFDRGELHAPAGCVLYEWTMGASPQFLAGFDGKPDGLICSGHPIPFQGYEVAPASQIRLVLTPPDAAPLGGRLFLATWQSAPLRRRLQPKFIGFPGARPRRRRGCCCGHCA